MTLSPLSGRTLHISLITRSIGCTGDISSGTLPEGKMIIIHSATEDDATKFRLYKEVCLNPHSTVIQLCEKLEIDKEYALNMLLELNKVDRLIAYTFHEDTTDDDKALWYKR